MRGQATNVGDLVIVARDAARGRERRNAVEDQVVIRRRRKHSRRTRWHKPRQTGPRLPRRARWLLTQELTGTSIPAAQQATLTRCHELQRRRACRRRRCRRRRLGHCRLGRRRQHHQSLERLENRDRGREAMCGSIPHVDKLVAARGEDRGAVGRKGDRCGQPHVRLEFRHARARAQVPDAHAVVGAGCVEMEA